MVQQAVLAVGGRGSRLGSSSPDGRPKSLLEVHGRPILHWTLRALRVAGVRRVLLVCDRSDFTLRIEEVARSTGKLFEAMDVITDEGQGVHGIPLQIADRLESRFLFEAGHSLLPHLHYRRMAARHVPGTWVMSSFVQRTENASRYPLQVPVGRFGRVPRVAALPYLLERDYCGDIQAVGFSIRHAIERRRVEQRIAFVETQFVPEFDQPDEMDHFQAIARSYLRSSRGQRDFLRAGMEQ
jgi:hypothetical protein